MLPVPLYTPIFSVIVLYPSTPSVLVVALTSPLSCDTSIALAVEPASFAVNTSFPSVVDVISYESANEVFFNASLNASAVLSIPPAVAVVPVTLTVVVDELPFLSKTVTEYEDSLPLSNAVKAAVVLT